LTCAIDDILIESAWVDANTLEEGCVVVVAIGAGGADAVDRVGAVNTVTVESVLVEDLVLSALIAVGVVAVGDFSGWFAGVAIL
jgi:riboflavin synthase